jgi:tRNA G18 (ribose-2'-O)-methylase SpoU
VSGPRRTTRVTTRNARFQQWEALLTNRTKRGRAGEFLVHGVRPITLAAERGWPIHALLYASGRRLSSWADGMLSDTGAERVEMAPDLLAELAGKDDAELVAVAGLPPDDLSRITPGGPVIAFDYDLSGPALIVIGNETRGMSAAWVAACDEMVRIPIGGAASSLNAAAAATVLLYEAARQREEK